MISCRCEVTLVRISSDSQLPVEKRRNYTGLTNAFRRILTEEGPGTFFRGCGSFVSRAMLVGAVQVGTYDQFRGTFKSWGITNPTMNVYAASMTSGLLYSIVTMPFETAKNRMASQKSDPVPNVSAWKRAIRTITTIAKSESVLRLWAGFSPYYLRCGGHTVFMFMAVEWLRKAYQKYS